MAGMAPASGVNAAVDRKWAKQSIDAAGNPLAMVNAPVHDLKLRLAQWPLADRRHEPVVLQGQLGSLFERYPGLQLLTMDARYAERDLCGAIVALGKDYPVRIKGNRPAVQDAMAIGFPAADLGPAHAATGAKKLAGS